MRKLLTVLVLTVLVGCGVPENTGPGEGGDIEKPPRQAVFEITWAKDWTQVQGAGKASANCCTSPSELKLTVTFADANGDPVATPPSTHNFKPNSPFKSSVPPGTKQIKVKAQGGGRTHEINDDDWHINNCFQSFVQSNATLKVNGTNLPPFPQAVNFASERRCSNGSLSRGSSHDLPIDSEQVLAVP